MLDEQLLRFDANQKYALFDFETCNLALIGEDNLPWELGLCICNKDTIIKDEDGDDKNYEILIDWSKVGRELRVGEQAAIITGFYNRAHLIQERGLHPEEALEIFEQYLYDPEYIPCAHNGLGFDVYIHNIMRRLLGKKPDYSYIERFLDTNLIARAWKMNATFPEDRKDLLAFQYKYSWKRERGIKTSVKALCEDFNIERDDSRAHQAKYDNHLLNQILKNLLWAVAI